MSMNREAYQLANEIRTELEAERNGLTDMEMKKYQTAVLGEIRKEKRKAKKPYPGLVAAACAAMVIFAGTTVFSDQVHAAIRQISWSISSALGISADLEEYREVVNTSVSDQGYVITLQEAVVAENTLVVNYTVQREDGQPMEQMMVPDGFLYINGVAASVGGSGSAGFLDEEEKVLGVVETYHVSADADLSQENEYRLSFDQIGSENAVKGKWDFAFTADGADLLAGTRRVKIGKEFELPDGVKVTLEEFTSNDLEQRISFSQTGGTRYMLMVMAEDQNGHKVEFGLRSANENSGYLQNEEILYDGRLEDGAGAITMTVYALELPEEDGQISDEYKQIGEAFVLE